MARTAARVLLGLLTMGILVAGGLVLGLYLGGATWAVNRVLAAVNPYPGTTLQSARVGGSLFRTIRVYDVRLTRPDGAIPVRLDSLTLTYDPRSLLGGGVLIQEARLAGPSVILTQRPDSKWDLLDLPRGASDSSSSSASSRSRRHHRAALHHWRQRMGALRRIEPGRPGIAWKGWRRKARRFASLEASVSAGPCCGSESCRRRARPPGWTSPPAGRSSRTPEPRHALPSLA